MAKVAFIGKWPSKGAHGEDLDQTRQSRAGTPLSDRFAVVEFRGDWILDFHISNTYNKQGFPIVSLIGIYKC